MEVAGPRGKPTEARADRRFFSIVNEDEPEKKKRWKSRYLSRQPWNRRPIVFTGAQHASRRSIVLRVASTCQCARAPYGTLLSTSRFLMHPAKCLCCSCGYSYETFSLTPPSCRTWLPFRYLGAKRKRKKDKSQNNRGSFGKIIRRKRNKDVVGWNNLSKLNFLVFVFLFFFYFLWLSAWWRFIAVLSLLFLLHIARF